jgi:uncharacterized protein YkwD
MRRKRLAIVGVAASALLLTGGVAATSAGAEETPDVPGWAGFSMPNLFDWPGFGDGSDVDDDNSWGDDPASDDAQDDQDDNLGTRDQPAPAAGQRAAAQAAQDAPAARPKPAAVLQRPALPQRPIQPDRPMQAQHQMQAQQQMQAQHQMQNQGSVQDSAGAAQRAAGAGLISASKQDVTAADISNSPNAPVQQQILALINQNRRRGGCDALSLDRRLIDAANEHAADMARRRYFAHESPNGDGAGDRVSENGYRWRRYGENIARGVDSPYEVVDGWMHSPAHRENIMDCRLHQMGIGLAISGDDTAYWVQDFATPMS